MTEIKIIPEGAYNKAMNDPFGIGRDALRSPGAHPNELQYTELSRMEHD
jgi:hypothetical protein